MMTESNTGRGILLRRRALPLLLAVCMVLTMGWLPAGQASAMGSADKQAKTASKTSGPSYGGATKPATYKNGDYKIFNCIDISNWQGKRTVEQFRKMKADGVTHVILRSSYTYTSKKDLTMDADLSFVNNIKNAHTAGLKIGIYHFSQAKTPAEAKKEANYTLQQINPYKSMITLPVVFDWEFNKRLTSSYARSKGKAYCTSICNKFCNVVKDEGYEPMVYANYYTLTNYLNDNMYQSWKIWEAQYSTTCSYSHDMYMWQYSSSGRIDGLSGNIDVNYLFAPIERIPQNNNTDQFKCFDVKKGRILTSQWVNLQGKSYRVDGEGNCLLGYQKVGNYYYGFDKNNRGAAYKNTTAAISGKTYLFDKKGRSVMYTAQTTKKLAYRVSPSIFSTKKGTYSKGAQISVIREDGDWVQASNGYWSKKDLTVLTTYPQKKK